MAEHDPNADFSELIASIMGFVLPGADDDDDDDAADRPEPPAPGHDEPWARGDEGDVEWRHLRETRRGPLLRPEAPGGSGLLHAPPRYYEWFPALRSLAPMTVVVSRSTQTMAVAIPRVPVESRTFPVPWARRARTASAGTQTEGRPQPAPEEPADPGWDPLPGEVFSLDEYTPQPLDASSPFPPHESRRPSLLVNPFHDPALFSSPFLQGIYGGGGGAAAAATPPPPPQGGSCLPIRGFPATRWPETLPQRDEDDDDDEVFVCSYGDRRRTVATNTFHVGWRRPLPQPVRFVRNRPIGSPVDSITADAATQTDS